MHDINKKALTKLLSVKGLWALVFEMYLYRVGWLSILAVKWDIMMVETYERVRAATTCDCLISTTFAHIHATGMYSSYVWVKGVLHYQLSFTKH